MGTTAFFFGLKAFQLSAVGELPFFLTLFRNSSTSDDSASESYSELERHIVERELGKYPTVSDVAMCEAYFKKKVPVIKKDTFTENNMRRFYIWIAFYFSSTNALRPSSIGNMKHKEFMNAFKRNELKIVCVEG